MAWTATAKRGPVTSAIDQTPEWNALVAHAVPFREGAPHHRLPGLFADDDTRGTRYTLDVDGLHVDYSKNLVNDETLTLLRALAERAGLRSRVDAMFAGDHLNVTEARSVLHTALRAPDDESIVVDGVDVVPLVHAVLRKMGDFTDRVRSGTWLGHTGQPVRNVVNIGIGGSDLGPAMAYQALRAHSDRNLTFRFVSNVDGDDFWEATHGLDPAETPSSRSRRTRNGFVRSESIRRTCSSSGIGSAVAIRSTLRSGCR
jgi:glucose-6-phosphate isomerase